MDTIRTGVVGVGHLGYHHTRLYSSIEVADLVGVVDVDPARAKEVADEFDTVAFATTEELLEAGVDAVSVVVPTRAHREVVIAVLEGGAHTLVEKPIAPTPDDARAMIAVAKEAGVLLQVGHVERFNGAVIALMGAIKNPRFIECHRMSPYPSRGHDVSVVHDLMIHDIDVVLALDGSEVVSLDAIGVSVFSEAEDIANVRLRFASGCVANLTASRISIDRMRKIRIFEENSYVSTDYSEQEVVVYHKKSDELAPGASPMEQISIESLEVRREEPLRLELEAFLGSIAKGEPPKVSGEDGLHALEIAEQVIDFMRKNR